MKYKYLKLKQSGDTIIEVMAAITILGLALGAAFGLSNRSFQTAIHTHDRVEALALAQGQVEFLKHIGINGDINNLLSKNNYINGQRFCFNDTNAADTTSCNSYRGKIYDISITYCSNSACGRADVFTIKASWIAGGSGKQNQLTIFYKPQR